MKNAGLLAMMFLAFGHSAAAADKKDPDTEGTVTRDPNDPSRWNVDFEKHPGDGSSDGDGGSSGGGGESGGGGTQWTDKEGHSFDRPDRDVSGASTDSGQAQGSANGTPPAFSGASGAPLPQPHPTPDPETRKRQEEEMRRQWAKIREMARNAADGLPEAAEALKDAVERNPDYLEWFGKHGTKVNVPLTIVEIVMSHTELPDIFPYDYRYSEFGKWLIEQGDISEIGAPLFPPAPEADGTVKEIPTSEKPQRKGFDEPPPRTSQN